MISFCFSSSVNSSKDTSDFSKRKNLSSGSNLLNISSLSSLFSLKNEITVAVFHVKLREGLFPTLL